MNIIEPSYKILTKLDGIQILKHIEFCSRTCYQSLDRQSDDSYLKFIKLIMNRNHESCLEHYSFSVKFITDRAIHNEFVRHRIASFSAESSRYCNYSNNKFSNEITVIKPLFFKEGTYEFYAWKEAVCNCEKVYMDLILNGCKPEEARTVLPLSLKTETVMTANLREWRHFFKLRTSPFAHPQMRQITIPLLEELKSKIPIVFDDVNISDESDTNTASESTYSISNQQGDESKC